MSDLNRREAIKLLHHCYPIRMNRPDGHQRLGTEALLERIHDVAVAAIEGEVIPSPVSDSADFVAST